MNVRIRPGTAADGDPIRRIAFETGFFGASMEALLDDRDAFEHSLDCYLRPAAATAFIAEVGDECVGYALASLGDVRLCTALSIAWGTAGDLLRSPWASAKTGRYVRNRVLRALAAAVGDERHFRTPSGARLHINVLEPHRHGGTGSQLMESLLADLCDRGIRRVHANSYQSAHNRTERFWSRHGFAEFSRVRTRVWRPFVQDEVSLVCYVREL